MSAGREERETAEEDEDAEEAREGINAAVRLINILLMKLLDVYGFV
jgi:hypothetical protein